MQGRGMGGYVQMWGSCMDTIEPEEILRISRDSIPAFIREKAGSRSLSPLMKRLNHDLLSRDRSASELAAQAIRHLGFAERP